MKNFNVLTTLLFCIFFVNISIAQTVKKQQINKELLTKKTKTDPNIKSADVLSDEKKSVSLIQKKTQKSIWHCPKSIWQRDLDSLRFCR